MNFIKIQNICSLKDTVKKMKTQTAHWEDIFPSDIPGKDLYPACTRTFKTQWEDKQSSL